jgi:cytochrome P450
MSAPPPDDWDPRSADVLRDQRAAFDDMRERCPVAYSDLLGWSLFRHADVSRVLHDPETFSSRVSKNVSVPNGMDPPEHDRYRRLIEPYFSAAAQHAFEPKCRDIAATLVHGLQGRVATELIEDFAAPFAVRVQCAFLGWPERMHEPLRAWTKKNNAARLAQDHAAMVDVAREFAGYVTGQLQAQRAGDAHDGHEVMESLASEQIDGRPLSDAEIISILRNWTVGEIGTLSAAIGIVAQFLAENTGVQQQLRVQPDRLPAAIDEILRLYGPLRANRRVTTRAVDIGGHRIEAGERISVNWVAANRDGRVFADAQAFRMDRDAGANLLYGAGIHVCPGATLSRMELRVALQALLDGTIAIAPMKKRPPIHAVFPASGFAVVPMRFTFSS